MLPQWLQFASLGRAFDLGVDLFPKADPATVSVQLMLPGASPDEISTSVVEPMEEAISGISGIDEMTALIREAAKQGANYVQTPEVSNMMQLNRKALFEHLKTEDDDPSLKAYRALAKELKIWLHIGSLALRFSPEKAVNRSFLIARTRGSFRSYSCAIS